MKTMTKVTDQKAEPSMEDILSSIREIISGEEESASRDRKRPALSSSEEQPLPTTASENQDVLDLIHMLREDNSVEVVSPYENPSAAQVELAAKKKKAKTKVEKEAKNTVEELTTRAAPKKKISPSEKKALETIAQNLTEMQSKRPKGGSAETELDEIMDKVSSGVKDAVASELEGDDLLSEDALSEAADALDVLNELADSVTAQSSFDSMGNKTLEVLMKEILRPLLKDWLDANLPSVVRTIVNEQVEKVVQQKARSNKSAGLRRAS